MIQSWFEHWRMLFTLFWCFYQHSAEEWATKLYKNLREYNIDSKLVTQTYESAPVMVGHHNEVQNLVHQQCAQAIFVLAYLI